MAPGSSYPEFLDHIGAKIALISAGENNRYQHPHKETLHDFTVKICRFTERICKEQSVSEVGNSGRLKR